MSLESKVKVKYTKNLSMDRNANSSFYFLFVVGWGGGCGQVGGGRNCMLIFGTLIVYNYGL